MKNIFILLAFLLAFNQLVAQISIDSSYSFQSNPAKKYSIYVPSSYINSIPNKMMLGMHPFNTSRWDAIAWRDTLINFAESNGLILLCPDGGTNGRVDDAIDFAFSTSLLDSIKNWYNIDQSFIYAMGFSVGGKATYTYGLNNDSVFGGFIPIGAAVNRTQEVNVALQLKSQGKPFYIIHGSFDSPSIRFIPVRDSLISKGAIVNSKLMSGVGHTIDFPNRNAILSEAFQWIDSVNTGIVLSLSDLKNYSDDLSIYPNPINGTESLNIDINLNFPEQNADLSIYSITGKKVFSQKLMVRTGKNELGNLSSLSKGTYIVSILLNKEKKRFSQEMILK